ncbi:uncharacterized protein SPPG_06126 [Spizellomyces punctatus DAOM BR117]|uniref:Peptidase S8/S53 domain-containing protein n=1 Tax=Spizellomyces punctatus (strain DAOM BR117) TaxID=645134 RepID=A0A0L0HB28_SPIPD|nr:uncharacterized protein SPPG_06126 [Spizellomyces punctatus DAOM BR117]KNC98422.1 hypothetical protein SPPG_06126 [Spizellomyces punctatus DAOM BR117]|eukprot:XP_016606462.1 hypothetical protein SPPG_06126 [Spizellomyces punctatus DAOM BR117]
MLRQLSVAAAFLLNFSPIARCTNSPLAPTDQASDEVSILPPYRPSDLSDTIPLKPRYLLFLVGSATEGGKARRAEPAPTYTLDQIEGLAFKNGTKPAWKHAHCLVVDDIGDLDFAQLGTLVGDVVRIEEDVQVSHDSWSMNFDVDPINWGLDRITQIFVDGKAITTPLNRTYIFPWTSTPNDVDVYVLGSGIQIGHSEFAGRKMSFDINFVGDGIDTDCFGHETHVASTIVGGTTGVARDATGIRVHAVKVLDCAGAGYMSAVMQGIQYVIDQHNAKVASGGTNKTVINMSLSGSKLDSANALVDIATSIGILVVVSAGNEAIDACASRSPASAATALTVAASTPGDDQAWFSSWGSCVNIYAPGTDILGAGIGPTNSSLVYKTGTSMSAPMVTGVAAVWLSNGWVGAVDQYKVHELFQGLLDSSLKGVIRKPTGATHNRLLNLSPCRWTISSITNSTTRYYCILHALEFWDSRNVCKRLGGVMANPSTEEVAYLSSRMTSVAWLGGWLGKSWNFRAGCLVLYPGGALVPSLCKSQLQGLCDITLPEKQTTSSTVVSGVNTTASVASSGSTTAAVMTSNGTTTTATTRTETTTTSGMSASGTTTTKIQ